MVVSVKIIKRKELNWFVVAVLVAWEASLVFSILLSSLLYDLTWVYVSDTYFSQYLPWFPGLSLLLLVIWMVPIGVLALWFIAGLPLWRETTREV